MLTRADRRVLRGQHPAEPTDIAGRDNWRVRFAMARLWADAPSTGTAVTPPLVHLPEIGLTGNMHFLFSDRNNLQTADQMSAFLAQKGLDS